MITDDGATPILMDFGSTMKARINVENRSQALLQQDIAAERSTMAYRAPELFDVKTRQMLDEKVDIWVSSFDHSHLGIITCNMLSTVIGLYLICIGLFPFAI